MIRRIGAIAFGLQLLGLMVWSAILYNRYSLTVDFAGNEQAWFLIAHGHLNPVIGPWGNSPFLRNHAEIIVLMLAPLYWIWHSGETLLWVQDVAAVATAWTAFIWIIEVAGTPHDVASSSSLSPQPSLSGWRRRPEPAFLAVVGLLLLVINPWVAWMASFDFHIQALATCFAMLAAFDLAHGRKRAWLWTILCMSCGDVAATFVFGVGLSAVVAGRSTRRVGSLMMGAALAMVATLTAAGANLGSHLYSYAPSFIVGRAAAQSAAMSGRQTLLTVLRAMVTHPWSYLAVLWGNALNLYANVSVAGIIGMATAWGFGVPFVVLLSNSLQAGSGTSLFAFQNFPIYAFLTLGTVMVLAGLGHHRPRITKVVAIVLVVNAIAWSAIWLPRVKSEWLKVPASTAATLRALSQQIKPDDEVVASQGITGPLPDRGAYFPLIGDRFKVSRRHVWFVVTPGVGIELESSSLAIEQLGYLTGSLHARLAADRDGVFAVEVTPPSDMKAITLPTRCAVLPAWAFESNAGRPVTLGPVSSWGMTSTGTKGYLVFGGYRRLPPDSYVAAVSLRSTGALTLEVWDSDRSLLLARREVPPTGAPATIDLPFVTAVQLPRPTTAGVGIWRTQPILDPPNDQVDIRIYSPGSHATVQSMEIEKAGPHNTLGTRGDPGNC
jgi:hypothetical protein